MRTTKRNGAKRQKSRINVHTVKLGKGRDAARGAKNTKKIPQQTKNIQSPSIVPETQQNELMVEREASNTKKLERYMLNEIEFIRTFGWWGLH